MKIYVYTEDWEVDYDVYGTKIVHVGFELKQPHDAEISTADSVQCWEDGIMLYEKEHWPNRTTGWA